MNAPVKRSPDITFLLSHPCHLISLGFGSGLSPIMPGTAGTLFAWISYDLLTCRFPSLFTPPVWGIICIIGFLIGIKTCQTTGNALNNPDDGSMVWDEIIAFWLILLFITPCSFFAECVAFALFRLWDMTKPQPIRFFDKHIHGGFGVMLDDIIAAFFTLLVFALWKTCFTADQLLY